MLLVAGPAAARGKLGATCDIYAVMPLLLHLAGHPLGEHLPGALPADLLDPTWLAANPPRRVEHFGPRVLPEMLLELLKGGAGDATYFAQLRQLGYAGD